MSTRATYQFVDEDNDVTIYKHHDGYPEGGYQWIARALKFAWPLPRFEADEFAAAFVAANKPDSGGVYLTTGRDAHGDTQFHYVVQYKAKELRVERWEPVYVRKPGAPKTRTWQLAESGTLEAMLDKYAPRREWVEDKVTV